MARAPRYATLLCFSALLPLVSGCFFQVQPKSSAGVAASATRSAPPPLGGVSGAFGLVPFSVDAEPVTVPPDVDFADFLQSDFNYAGQDSLHSMQTSVGLNYFYCDYRSGSDPDYDPLTCRGCLISADYLPNQGCLHNGNYAYRAGQCPQLAQPARDGEWGCVQGPVIGNIGKMGFHANSANPSIVFGSKGAFANHTLETYFVDSSAVYFVQEIAGDLGNGNFHSAVHTANDQVSTGNGEFALMPNRGTLWYIRKPKLSFTNGVWLGDFITWLSNEDLNVVFSGNRMAPPASSYFKDSWYFSQAMYRPAVSDPDLSIGGGMLPPVLDELIIAQGAVPLTTPGVLSALERYTYVRTPDGAQHFGEVKWENLAPAPVVCSPALNRGRYPGAQCEGAMLHRYTAWFNRFQQMKDFPIGSVASNLTSDWWAQALSQAPLNDPVLVKRTLDAAFDAEFPPS